MNESQKDSPFYLKSTIEITEAAKNVVSTAPEEFQDSIEPYFVARYFVAIYEARNGEIPIQVWNEYRNALDHLFRYLVSDNTEKQQDGKNQIKSAQKHFLRAALDILKLHVHKTQDYIKEIKSSYEPVVLDLVDNGLFIKEFNHGFREAEKLFEQAKINDLDLGDNHAKNSSVLIRYLDAACAFEKLREDIGGASEKIQIAKNKHDDIHHRAHNHSTVEGVKIHLLASIISFVSGSLVTVIIQNYSAIIENIRSLF